MTKQLIEELRIKINQLVKELEHEQLASAKDTASDVQEIINNFKL